MQTLGHGWEVREWYEGRPGWGVGERHNARREGRTGKKDRET